MSEANNQARLVEQLKAMIKRTQYVCQHKYGDGTKCGTRLIAIGDLAAESNRAVRLLEELEAGDSVPAASQTSEPSTLASATGSATTHDYTKRYWGHDYTITDVRKHGAEISMMGWGHGISAGDYMLIVGQSKEPGANPDTRYRVKSVRYMGDPSDMWSMECAFAPRKQSPNE